LKKKLKTLFGDLKVAVAVNVSIKISSYYFRNDVEKAVAVHGKPDLFSCMRPERMRRLCTPEASDLVWMPAIKWRMDSQFSFAYASSPGMSMGFFSSSVEITPKEALSPLRKKERKKGDFKRTHGHGKGGRERSLPSGIGVLEVLPKWRAHNELPPVLGADFKGSELLNGGIVQPASRTDLKEPKEKAKNSNDSKKQT